MNDVGKLNFDERCIPFKGTSFVMAIFKDQKK